MFFSVVIPTFNRSSLIESAIDSALNQNFADREIIVVDDGSTDNTLELLEKYGSQIKVLKQKNKGVGGARNLGIRHAKGRYIVFLDSDDFWFPWTLSTLFEVIKLHNHPSFVVGEALLFQRELELKSVNMKRIESQYLPDYYSYSWKILQPFVGAVAIQKAVLEEVNGFTIKQINSEDNDLWLKLGTARGFVHIQCPVILGYRQHAASAISNTEKSFQGALFIIQQEKKSVYPGGEEKLINRLEILTRHVRPVSLACLKQEELIQALILYEGTFVWHLKLLRFRYLIAFPTLFIIACVRRAVLSIPRYFVSRKQASISSTEP